jgi:ketosteroid isomerase-like protein
MRMLRNLIVVAFMAGGCAAGSSAPAVDDRASLEKTTAAIRDAFARGDVSAVVALHHPNVMKWFGGNNVVNGRAALEKGLIETFRSAKLEFIENRIESIVFNGETAVETSIFTIKGIPKNGGEPTLSRGRAMVVYVRYKDSPTGWASLREMAQAAPSEN